MASLAWINLADAGTLSASSAVSTMPITRLQNEHVSRRWRSTADSANFTLDLGADTTIDTVALFGLTLSASATIRIRISNAAGGSTSGNLVDSGALTSASALWDENLGAFVLATSTLSARYVRFDLADTPGDYVEAGRLFVGVRTDLDFNFAPGAERGRRDFTRRSETIAGGTLVDPQPQRRFFNLTFDWITAAQWESVIEEIERENGLHTDVLLILDDASSNVPRDTIWGLLTDLSPATFLAIPDLYSKQIRVEERL